MILRERHKDNIDLVDWLENVMHKGALQPTRGIFALKFPLIRIIPDVTPETRRKLVRIKATYW